MPKLFEYLDKQPKSVIVAITLFLVIMIGLVDMATSEEFSVIIFYFVPIFLGSWFIGTGAGMTLSFLSTITWALADGIFSKGRASSLTPYWNFFAYICFFFHYNLYTQASENRFEPRTLYGKD